MKEDDPEKRIRELERGLADADHSGSPKITQSGYDITVKQG